MTIFERSPRPTTSRWGQVDQAEEWRPGIWMVSTPGHGGLILSVDRWRAIPPYLRETPYSSLGQFEEDCDWCIPIVVFAKEFVGWKSFEAQPRTVLEFAIDSFERFILPVDSYVQMAPDRRDDARALLDKAKAFAAAYNQTLATL